MRRRDFTIGLSLSVAVRAVRAQQPAKHHRIAIIAAGPVARIDDPGNLFFHAIFEKLRRLGDVEGQNLTVDRYSGGGRPQAYADVAREVIARSPEVIVASGNALAQAVRTEMRTIPIVWIGGDPVEAGFATSLALPGGSVTGVTVDTGREIGGSASRSSKKLSLRYPRSPCLDLNTPNYERQFAQPLLELGRRLNISLIDMLVQESTPAEYQRVFVRVAQERPDGIYVGGTGELRGFRQLIVELVEKSRVPAIYGSREYAEIGGLMSYEFDQSELGRRIADDVHEILNGTKPGDIPIYQPTKFEFVINLKAAKTLGLTIPPALLALADEVIE
jgi:putative tryptophan/tyrosine transport system substrate-binding protein